MGWIDYWSDTGFDAAFWRRSLQDYVERLHRQAPFAPHERVLDFGAGPGFLGPALAPRVARVCLADPSPTLCAYAERLVADLDDVRVLHLPAHAGLAALPREPFDAIVVNSVLQYLAPADARATLLALGERLAPGGRLIISDLVPVRASLLPELREVFHAYRRWFGLRAFARFLARELVRAPRRACLPLARYDRGSFEALVAPELELRWIENPTVCRSRLAALARPVSAG